MYAEVKRGVTLAFFPNEFHRIVGDGVGYIFIRVFDYSVIDEGRGMVTTTAPFDHMPVLKTVLRGQAVSQVPLPANPQV